MQPDSLCYFQFVAGGICISCGRYSTCSDVMLKAGAGLRMERLLCEMPSSMIVRHLGGPNI